VNSIKITFFTARNRTRSVNPFDCCSLAFACATCATHLILFHSSFICQSPAPRPPAPLLYILFYFVFCILYFVHISHSQLTTLRRTFRATGHWLPRWRGSGGPGRKQSRPRCGLTYPATSEVYQSHPGATLSEKGEPLQAGKNHESGLD